MTFASFFCWQVALGFCFSQVEHYEVQSYDRAHDQSYGCDTRPRDSVLCQVHWSPVTITRVLFQLYVNVFVQWVVSACSAFFFRTFRAFNCFVNVFFSVFFQSSSFFSCLFSVFVQCVFQCCLSGMFNVFQCTFGVLSMLFVHWMLFSSLGECSDFNVLVWLRARSFLRPAKWFAWPSKKSRASVRNQLRTNATQNETCIFFEKNLSWHMSSGSRSDTRCSSSAIKNRGPWRQSWPIL